MYEIKKIDLASGMARLKIYENLLRHVINLENAIDDLRFIRYLEEERRLNENLTEMENVFQDLRKNAMDAINKQKFCLVHLDENDKQTRP